MRRIKLKERLFLALLLPWLMWPRLRCLPTAEVIVQVEGEFRGWGFPVTMSKPTIN